MPAPTIAFESIAAPGATPIVVNAASAKSFANNYSKAGPPYLSQRDRKQIQIIGLIAELNANGGANYTANHTVLRQDAAVYTHGISKFNLEIAMCALDWNAGKVADSTLSTDIPTLLAAGPKLNETAAEDLDRIIAFLRAQLRK